MIVATGKDILLRPEDLIRLVDRFLQASGENYSFADTLQGKNRTVDILTFDGQLAAYSG